MKNLILSFLITLSLMAKAQVVSFRDTMQLRQYGKPTGSARYAPSVVMFTNNKAVYYTWDSTCTLIDSAHVHVDSTSLGCWTLVTSPYITATMYVTKYDNDTAKANFLRIGQPIAVIDSLGNLTDLATVNQLRYDSIKMATANPAIGNEYFNTTDNSLRIKSGTHWFRFLPTDSTSAVTATLASGLTAYYKFDEESGNAIDATGNYNATSDFSISKGVTGKINTAYAFDGSQSQVQIPNVISTNVFSIGAWVYTISATIQTILSGQTTGMPDFQINANGTLDLLSRATKDIASSTGAITYGAWNYVSVTFDASGNYVFYINGASAGSGNNPTTFTNLSSNYYIGTLVGASQFNGSIDELGIWSRAITSGDDTNLYNGGAGHAYPLN